MYCARHRQLGSLHAIKLLNLPIPGLKRRLIQEGSVQASMRHPNIVQVSDVVEHEGCPGLVMEYVDGPTLGALLAAGSLPPERVDVLAEGILRGVGAAHRRGWIHRDLKPANILIATVDGGPVPKIADFGVAKVLDPSGVGMDQTRTGQTLGTPCYMGPEQLQDAKRVDQRADVYALGAILYEMLVGTRLIDGATPEAALAALQERAALTSLDALTGVSPSKRAAIKAALTLDAEGRPASADALLGAWTDAGGAQGHWWDALRERAARLWPRAS